MFAISAKKGALALPRGNADYGPKPHTPGAVGDHFARFILILVVATLLALWLASVASGIPPVEPLGVNGTLIDLPPRHPVPGPGNLPNRAFRVDHVIPGMPAATLRLERGDLIVAIDSMRFTTAAGFRHALICSSDHPSFLVWRARSGRFTIQNIAYPHRQPDPDENRPRPPHSYWMSIDIR